jgi:hypothetical protein
MSFAPGAVIYPRGFAIDGFMASVASALRRRAPGLSGVVQHNVAGGCEPSAMVLEDIATGDRFPISQSRGAGAAGCRLDAAGLAAAAAALDPARTESGALVIVNKFGRQEALGVGLRAEIAAAVLAGRRVLIAVREDLVADWEAFAGPDWMRLPPSEAEVIGWAVAPADAMPADG